MWQSSSANLSRSHRRSLLTYILAVMPSVFCLNQLDGHSVKFSHRGKTESPAPNSLDKPSDVVLYVTSGDDRPQGRCSCETWVSDALEFGFRVVFYSGNSSHFARDGSEIPTRHVKDFGALSGDRGRGWVTFGGEILKDVLAFAPDAKFVMRLDDDTFLNPYNLWRSLLALPLDRKADWMIGDCGDDEHHSKWCGGGAGIVLSRSLATKLSQEMLAGYQSKRVCALVGNHDDDTMGICARALMADITGHHGFHWWPPVDISSVKAPALWQWRPPWLGGASLDGCRAEALGPFIVVQDWITYHHTSCEQQRAMSHARHERGEPSRPKGDEAAHPPCSGALRDVTRHGVNAADRCRASSEFTQTALCGFG